MSISEKLTTIAENELKVYKAGQKSEYDAFWDSFQRNGELKGYTYAFAGNGWNEETFKPKYNMQPTSCSNMFRDTTYLNFDLVEHLEELGVELDFSKSTGMTYVFINGRFTRVGIIDTTSASSINYIFQNSRIETIDKLILKNDGSQTLTSSFLGMAQLRNITIEGVIGKTVSFENSENLSKDSIISIVNALSNTTSSLTLTLDINSVAKAFSSEPDIPTLDGDYSPEWLALVATKPNWTITLV